MDTISDKVFADYMTFNEYIYLIGYIDKYHSAKRCMGKRIKYLSHEYDFRTGRIYSVTLNNKQFSKTNENKDKNLLRWVIDYLNE